MIPNNANDGQAPKATTPVKVDLNCPKLLLLYSSAWSRELPDQAKTLNRPFAPTAHQSLYLSIILSMDYSMKMNSL
jgi:hypothetical protein